jgi:hypothetical protein
MGESKAIGNTTGHRTKNEKTLREAAEKAALTGIEIRERQEVANNEYAHAEFERLIELLTAVGKNDAIIETVVNRYCFMLYECADFERKRDKFNDNLDALMDNNEIEAIDKYRLEAQMQKSILEVDKQIQTKRRMLFDIEKENGFTIAAALRSIPKKPDKKISPLEEALRDDGE